MDLTTAIGNALRPALPESLARPPSLDIRSPDLSVAAGDLDSAPPANNSVPAPAPPAAGGKPVIQLAAIPVTIDPALYRNPLTSTNPGGDYRPLRAFRDLVDPVPTFSRYYAPGPTSIEGAWGAFVNGASAGADTFARLALATAQRQFAGYELGALSGLPDSWRPVYASPADWYDFSVPGRFAEVEMDLSDLDTSQGPFSTIPGAEFEDTLMWRMGDPAHPGSVVPLHPDTKLRSICFKAMEVTLQRPWMDFSLLQLGGITLGGQRPGLYSSGRLDDNPGVLPLVPTSCYLAIDLQIVANWAPQDTQVLEDAARASTSLALGRFALSSGLGAAPAGGMTFDQTSVSSSVVQLIAWISALVPFCPAAPA
ncbi:MAG TPA: hypothetical protein VFJ16_20295 [Longimicrobium sp.]|nr:hypothetical protein [Longimicrobium sp.]